MPGNASRCRNRHHGGVQITSGQDQQRARTYDLKLAEQQYCRNEGYDKQRKFVNREKRPGWRKRNPGKRCRDQAGNDCDADNNDRLPALVLSGAVRRQEKLIFLRAEFHLPQIPKPATL